MVQKEMPISKWMADLARSNTQLVFVIADAEKFLAPESSHVLSLLSRVVEEYDPHVQLLLLFERDITHPENTTFLPASTRIYENIFGYPLYDAKETESFVRLLSKQWDVSVDRSTMKSILEGCGGNFWLVKEAMREIVTQSAWSPKDPGMMFRVRMVYERLHESEKTVLRKRVKCEKNLSEADMHSNEYLESMRFFTTTGDVPRIYREYILRKHDMSNALELRDNKLILQKMPLDAFLSRKEYRVMKCLLEKRGALVTREDIARQLWPANTQKHYSDWAIDQMVARLRKKMTQLSLNPKLLKTLRGKGYMLAVA
jgi:hypothetical protein